jgi:hypothetical protein
MKQVPTLYEWLDGMPAYSKLSPKPAAEIARAFTLPLAFLAEHRVTLLRWLRR